VLLTFHIILAPGCEWVGDIVAPAQACHGVTFTFTVMNSRWNLNPSFLAGLKAKNRDAMTQKILTGVKISKSGSFEE